MSAETKKPDLTLSMDDKIYLAVAYKQSDGMGFIYMLICNRVDKSRYALFPETQIMTFKNATDAKIYYQTLLQIQEFQDTQEICRKFKKTNEPEIQKFLSAKETTKNR